MRPAVYCIEGESVTARDIAERTGLAMHSIWNKIKREQAKDAPLTWGALHGTAKAPRGTYKARKSSGWY